MHSLSEIPESSAKKYLIRSKSQNGKTHTKPQAGVADHLEVVLQTLSVRIIPIVAVSSNRGPAF
jgi:hypothetical protein